MADEQQTQESPDNAPPTGGGARVLMLAFVGLVVLMEAGMFFFLVPSAEEVRLMAEEALIQSVQEVDEPEDDEKDKEDELQEYQLGRYVEVFSPHGNKQTYRVMFQLYGLVQGKNVEKIKEELAKKEGRVRSRIRQRLRNSTFEELRSNNLGLIERRILTACNHVLEENLLLGIGFKSYELIEQ